MKKTLLQVRTEVRNRGEFLEDYYPSTELNAYINDSVAALYELLLTADRSRYRSTSTVSIVSGTVEYALPSDFLYLITVDVTDSGNPSGYRDMQQFNERERNEVGSASGKNDLFYYLRGDKFCVWPKPAFSEATCIRINYVPTPTALSADTNTFDFHIGYDWVVNDVCLKCATKANASPTVWAMERRRAEERIFKNSRIDQGEPNSPSKMAGGWTYNHRWRGYPRTR